MSEAAKRLRAAIFARAPLHAEGTDAHRERLARLRATAEERGYAVVLERTDAAPPWRAHVWVHELLEAADAGTFHALLVHDVRELGESMAQANWLASKLQRVGVWIVELGDDVDHVLVPVLEGRRSRGRP